MSLQQFPYPCSVDDRFILAISRTFPLFMTLSWIYSSAMIIKSIVYEKERRLKETMRVMGLGNLVHWLSWFIDSFVVMMFSSGMLSLLLKVSLRNFLGFMISEPNNMMRFFSVIWNRYEKINPDIPPANIWKSGFNLYRKIERLAPG